MIVVVVGGGLYYATTLGGNKVVTTTAVSTVTSTATTSVSTVSGTTSVSTVTASTSTTSWFPTTIQSGGSSFVNPVMQVWAVGFNQFTNGAVQVNYQSVGSGAGITGVTHGTFSYAGSDAPFANSTSSGGTLLNIPETLGAVAIFYNIPGVTINLNLTGDIIAKIYLQNITTWNDPAILAINPKANATLLNHVIVLGEDHARQLLRTYRVYYNGARTHLSLSKDSPDSREIDHPEHGTTVAALPVLGGLHHRYRRRAA